MFSIYYAGSDATVTTKKCFILALCYKPEGRGFDSRCHWIFQLT
jgi:hypothetical protein